MLENSIDPAQQRRAQKLILSDGAANSFEAVAREWHAKGVPGWSTGHAKKTLTRLEQDIFPWIGTRPIGDIKAPEMLMALRRIEARGAIHTAHRIHQNCGQIMRYAIATGRAERDIASDLRGAIQPETRVHHASIVEPKHIGNLLREMEIYDGLFATKCALRLAPLVFLRPGELRHAEWSEINFDDAEWRIPATKMKMGVVHIVPLSTQAASILRQVYEC